MPTLINLTFQLLIAAGQPQGVLDIPTNYTQPMQLQRLSATATSTATNIVHNDIATIVESNGFFVRPVEGDKPDIAMLPRATLRIICSRTAPSVDPVRVLVAVGLTEAPKP